LRSEIKDCLVASLRLVEFVSVTVGYVQDDGVLGIGDDSHRRRGRGCHGSPEILVGRLLFPADEILALEFVPEQHDNGGVGVAFGQDLIPHRPVAGQTPSGRPKEGFRDILQTREFVRFPVDDETVNARRECGEMVVVVKSLVLVVRVSGVRLLVVVVVVWCGECGCDGW
jgi:hypothetical protein